MIINSTSLSSKFSYLMLLTASSNSNNTIHLLHITKFVKTKYLCCPKCQIPEIFPENVDRIPWSEISFPDIFPEFVYVLGHFPKINLRILPPFTKHRSNTRYFNLVVFILLSTNQWHTIFFMSIHLQKYLFFDIFHMNITLGIYQKI